MKQQNIAYITQSLWHAIAQFKAKILSEFHKVQWVCPDGIIILGMWEKYEFSQWSICDCTLLVTLCGVRDHPVITSAKRLGGSRKCTVLLTFSPVCLLT